MEDRIGPYRVEEQIGAGGMGEVYRAYDDRLERWVAIKRIRGDKDEAEENRERFQREARATAKLSHASIVHLYDIFRDGDSDCIVMEYVEGTTLDTLIKNGPLEPLQAAMLGREIAAGLAEAHDKGIIHRDLKVENIIVTPQGHAKILDFGLARPLLKNELDTSLTGKGQLVGTSRAMSPEYVSGEDIDHRSDLFSLGVLIYETVTSHSPFRAHNTLATLRQVMLHHQTPAHHVNSNVPEELSDLINELLEKDPDDRPESAREVAHRFGRISGQLSSGDVDRPIVNTSFTTTPTEVFTPSATSIDLWGRRRWLATVTTILVLAMLLTFGVTRWWLGKAGDPSTEEVAGSEAPAKKDRIVSAQFQNQTREPLFDDSLDYAFRLGLEQSRTSVLLPKSQIVDALLRMERDPDTLIDRDLGIEISQREGARALVIGSIAKIGETYSVSAEVVDPQSGATAFAEQASTDDRNAVIATLETITKAIRLHLGESQRTIEESKDALERVTTRDLEALKAYSLGVEKNSEGDERSAILLFERALELDQEFAMAHAKLATIYLRLDLDRSQALHHLDSALRLSERLTDYEKLYVQGWAARLNGDSEEVIRTWSLMSDILPEEFAGHYNLGMAYWYYSERWEHAARAFEAASRVATSKTRSLSLNQLAYCQIALGRFDEALASLEKSSGHSQKLALADLYVVRRQYEEARPLIQDFMADPSPFPQVRGRFRNAEYFASQGRLVEAQVEAREASKVASAEGMRQFDLVGQLAMISAMEHAQQQDDLREMLNQATSAALKLADIDKEKVESLPFPILALVGKLNARNGHIENAEAISSLTGPLTFDSSVAVWKAYAMMLEGEILAAQGELDDAASRFVAALPVVDSFQVRESLARAYTEQGMFEAAIEQYEWIIEHRSQGLVECLDQCHVLSAVDSSIAEFRLAQLYEQVGDHQKASKYYQRFIDLWPSAESFGVGKQLAGSKASS